MNLKGQSEVKKNTQIWKSKQSPGNQNNVQTIKPTEPVNRRFNNTSRAQKVPAQALVVQNLNHVQWGESSRGFELD